MHVPLPRPLKIDRAALLRDVRARLADRLPAYAVGEPDPTDPGWLLLGEAAWMVELLTEQLDRAPLSSLQHLIHLMGGHLLPATPALAAVVCGVAAPGKLTQNPDLPDQTRFFSRSDERAGPIEFVPVEPELWLHDARLGPLATLRGGNLYSCGRPWPVEGFGELGAWVGPAERASLFDEERGLFTVAAANPDQVAAAMGAAVAEIEKLRLGWLKLEIMPVTGERVTLAARVDLALPFRRVIEAGIWPGGDL